MELNVLENSAGKLKVEVRGETHTLLNIITEYAWVAKATQASYIISHPYLSEPELIVRSQNPKKTLSDAAGMVIEKTDDFQKSFKRAQRK